MAETFCGKNCDLCQEKRRKNAEDAKKGQAGVLAVTVPLRIAVGKNITQTAIPVRKP